MIRVTHPASDSRPISAGSPFHTHCIVSSVRKIPPTSVAVSTHRIGSPSRRAPRPRTAESTSRRYGSATAPTAAPSSSTTAQLNDDQGRPCT
jgi:hypothetical protein